MNDSVDIIDGEHNTPDAQRIHRCIHRPKSDRVRRVELVQFYPLPIRSPHHCKGGPDILEPDQFSDQWPFDCLLPLKLNSLLN